MKHLRLTQAELNREFRDRLRALERKTAPAALRPADVSSEDVPHVRVHLSGTQSITLNTNTAIIWNAVSDNDPYGFWDAGDPTKLTVPDGRAGMYLVTAGARYSANALWDTWIRANGSDVHARQRFGNATTQASSMSVVLPFRVGDYIELLVNGSASGSVGHASEYTTYIQMARISGYSFFD